MNIKLMDKKPKVERLKKICSTLVVLGLLMILLSVIGPEAINRHFISGIGSGILMPSSIFLVILKLKSNDINFKEEIEVSETDERLIAQGYKIRSLLFYVIILEIIALTIFSMYSDISFEIGGFILLFSTSIIKIILKIYYKNK